MTAISSRAIRLACDLARPNATLDQRTNLPPAAARSASLRFQLAAFLGSTILDDVSGYLTLSLGLRSVNNDGTLGATVATVAIAGSAFAACTADAWAAGTGQHAVLDLTSAQLNLDAGNYFLTIYGDTATSGRVFWSYGRFTILDAGAPADTPPAPADIYATIAENDSRYMPRTPPSGGYRFKDNGLGDFFFQLKDSATGKYRSLFLTNGELEFGPEEI